MVNRYRLLSIGPDLVGMLKTYSVCLYLRRCLATSGSHFGPGFKSIPQEKAKDGEGEEKPGHSEPNLVNIYNRLNTWKSQSQLVDKLHSNVVFYNPEEDNHGLVVVNKPYGLAVKEAKDSQYCLEGCLGGLAGLLGVKDLHVIKSVERFCSGIALLGTSEETNKQVTKAVGKSRSQRMLSSSYMGLVLGYANLPGMDTGQVVLELCPSVEKPLFSDRHKEPVIYRNLSTSRSRTSLDRRNAKLFHMGAQLISNSGTHPVSLVRLDPSTVKNHFPLVWLSDQGHPLLGDHMYDYRSSSLMGHKVRVGTKHTQASRQQKLPINVAERLSVRKGEEWRVPKLLHHHRIHLPEFLGKEKDLTVFAPLPPHFRNTCRALGVTVDWKEVAKTDQVKVWPVHGNANKNKLIDESKSDLDRHVKELN